MHMPSDRLIPEGIDSHTFEPAPSVEKVLTQAVIIFVNGLKLESIRKILLCGYFGQQGGPK
jgi:ABC-type Zn uptake system ZnuABC Zn-binding protein ZnuA